jgi:hypothetical protein
MTPAETLGSERPASPPPLCPPDCPDRAKHAAYAADMARWEAGLGIDADSTANDPGFAVVHRLHALSELGADHDKTCMLLYGSRSMLHEIAAGMALLTGIPEVEITSKITMTCGPTADIEAVTRLVDPQSPNPDRISISHGFHLFGLNCSMITGALLGKAVPQIPTKRGRLLLMDQLYFFWVQGDKNALLFPYFAFGRAVLERACGLAMLMRAFLIAHEMAHIVVNKHSSNPLVSQVRGHATRFVEKGFPPPFGVISPEGWRECWIEEFVCDGLAALSVLSCSTSTVASAFADAPKVSETTLGMREAAIELMTLYLDALYIRNLPRRGSFGKTGFEALYLRTHPMPHLRRMFVRGAADMVNPECLKEADRHADAFRAVFDRQAWLIGAPGSNEKDSSQEEADAVVPDFLQRLEKPADEPSLDSIASLGTEAMYLAARFASTSHGDRLRQVEAALRSKMSAMTTGVLVDRLMERTGGQLSGALQLVESMEEQQRGAVNHQQELTKTILDDVRHALGQRAIEFAHSVIAAAKDLSKRGKAAEAQRVLKEALAGLEGFPPAIDEIAKVLASIGS